MKRKHTMFLPETIAEIINTLENAGFAAYVVGGCVRDACLGPLHFCAAGTDGKGIP